MKSQSYGIAASALMLALYTVVVSYFNSFGHAVAQFVSLWPLMTLLIVGFGAQVGLFFYFKEKVAQRASTIAFSGTMSTSSMVACCAHHISDALPLVGAPLLAAFAVKYQVFFVSLGVVSNVLGILFMLRMMQHHKIRLGRKSNLWRLMKLDMDKAFRISLAAGAILLFLVFMTS